jgi:uncharacterized repeat protein (TIGR03803 family)
MRRLAIVVETLCFSVLLGLAGVPAPAQVVSTLYNFGSAAGDGAFPQGGLIQDASGNLYGTTGNGGTAGGGTVFELVKSGNTYTEKVLYNFGTASGDGAGIPAGLIMDASGNLFGITDGGGANGVGTVFELINSPAGYREVVLYTFAGSPQGPSADGATPYGSLLIDGSGNLFGTTVKGGAAGVGTVFELSNSSGSYTEQVLYSFTNVGGDGANPYGTLIQDASGNLYGTTFAGGSGYGTVFELVNSSGTYSESILHTFTNSAGDGANSIAGLVRDASGNLYGTTTRGGVGAGMVFELVNASGVYSEKVIYAFTGAGSDGSTPYTGLILDSFGNLYGTTLYGGIGAGTVFELSNASGSWLESQLAILGYSCNGSSAVSASNPYYGYLMMDAAGNIYATVAYGGSHSAGAIVSIMPSAPSTQSSATLVSSANPVEAGFPVSFTATFTSQSGSGYPAGTASLFTSNGSVSLSAPMPCGVAVFSIADALTLGVGTNTVTARYNPDPTDTSKSITATVSQTVSDPGIALTNTNNTFNGNQTVNGAVAATSFSGNGSGLLNLNPANIGPGTANISITGQAGSALIAASLSGNILESQVTGLATDMAGRVPLSAIGTPNGVAALDSTGKVPSAQLPTASSGSTPAILTGFCTGVASSTNHSTFALAGLGALANGACSNGVNTSTAVGIPMTAAGTLSGLTVYPGAAGNSGTALTVTVYKALAPGWSVTSGVNQATVSSLSYNRLIRRVTLNVASSLGIATGNIISVTGISGAYNAGTNCTALSGALFDGSFTVASVTATTIAFADSAIPTNCGSNITNAAATGTVADTTSPTFTTATRTAPTATTLTCAIGALTSPASAVCSDTSDAVAVSPGDLISVIASSSRSSGTETVGEIRVTLQKQ